VHIADPTRWLLPEDELDLEARRRGTTVYLPTDLNVLGVGRTDEPGTGPSLLC